MVDGPLVSVITTVHNLVEHECIDAFNLLIALLDLQTYDNIEHIIIDKNSNDNTIDLLKDYKNKEFVNFYSGMDTGKYNARNQGIMRAKGKYVTFLNCNDFIHDVTAIADIVDMMETNNGDFSFAPAYCRHPQGFTFLFMPAIYNAFQVMPCARQAMFFKKSVLEQENYFEEKFKLLADFDLIMKLLLHKRNGLYFETNYVTYKFSQSAMNYEERAIAEAKAIMYKNFKSLYPLNEDLLNKMVKFSEFPQGLLEKLAMYFPEEDRGVFLDRCEEMHQVRIQALQNAQQDESQNVQQ